MSTIPDNGPTFIAPRQPDFNQRIDLKALKARPLMDIAPRSTHGYDIPAAFVPVAERELAALLELAEAAKALLDAADIRYASDGFTSLYRLEEALSRVSFDA